LKIANIRKRDEQRQQQMLLMQQQQQQQLQTTTADAEPAVWERTPAAALAPAAAAAAAAALAPAATGAAADDKNENEEGQKRVRTDKGEPRPSVARKKVGCRELGHLFDAWSGVDGDRVLAQLIQPGGSSGKQYVTRKRVRGV